MTNGLVIPRSPSGSEKMMTELASAPNHCSDAALYGWRSARPFLAMSVPKPPATGADNAAAFWQRQHEEMEDDDLFAA